MKKPLLILLIFGLLGCFGDSVYGQQTPSIQNIQNLNVDDLSDAQIQKFVDRIEASGYTQDQLILLAKSRGMSDLQIQKLRRRINQLSVSSDATTIGSISRIRDNPLGIDSALMDFSDPFAVILIDSIPELKILE